MDENEFIIIDDIGDIRDIKPAKPIPVRPITQGVKQRLHKLVTLFPGDCLDAMRQLDDDCIDAMVTDPPYHLQSVVKRFGSPTAAPLQDYEGGTGVYKRSSAGFMGKVWDGGDISFQPELWAEVIRVLKPGGYIAVMGGTRTYHRMVCAIEDAGFDIRDTLCWLYGQGFPKSHDMAKAIDRELGVNGSYGDPKSSEHARLLEAGTARRGPKNEGWDRPWMDDPEAIDRNARQYIPVSEQAKHFDGFGTALKPACELICLARKPLSEKTIAQNVLVWGTGALNIDACRVGTEAISTHSRGSNGAFPKRPTETTPEESGRIKDQRIGLDHSERNGRWPANVITDGSDEVVGMFPNQKSPDTYKRNVPQGYGNGNIYSEGGERDTQIGYGDSGSAARFFYCAKASKEDRNGSKHPTVKPIALMQWLVRLITPPNGCVLDPFAGSGTTAVAAVNEGFQVIVCENEPEYQDDIRRRFNPEPEVIELTEDPIMLVE